MTNSKSNNRARRQIDWPAIKVDYLLGRPISAIARRFGVGSSTIYARIQRHGWSAEDAADLPALELAQLRALAGKLRERLKLPTDSPKKEMEERVLSLPKVRDAISNREIVKVVIVPNRLVNIVLK